VGLSKPQNDRLKPGCIEIEEYTEGDVEVAQPCFEVGNSDVVYIRDRHRKDKQLIGDLEMAQFDSAKIEVIQEGAIVTAAHDLEAAQFELVV
jgi:hypothetical protein